MGACDACYAETQIKPSCFIQKFIQYPQYQYYLIKSGTTQKNSHVYEICMIKFFVRYVIKYVKK